MKSTDKEPSFFGWIRAVRAEIDRETEGMTPDEFCAYSRARALEADKRLPKFTPEEAERELHAILYPEEAKAPSRRAATTRRGIAHRKAVAAKTTASRRKVAKRSLAHA